MVHKHLVEQVVRHHLPVEQLASIVDFLLVMLTAPNEEVYVISGGGEETVGASMPPIVYQVVLDAVSLLAAKGTTALVAVDDTKQVNQPDLERLLAVTATKMGLMLEAKGIRPKPPASGRGGTFVLSEVIEAFRPDRARPGSADENRRRSLER